VILERYRPVIADWADFAAAAARPEPTVLRVRTGRIAPDVLRDRLAAQGFRLRRLEGMPAFFQVEEGPHPVSVTLEHWLGLFYVQQASTGVAAPLLGAEPGERVLDLCAAPGGKTTHVADLMEDRGCLVAADVSESRIRGLLGNVYRLGHANLLVVAGDGREFPEGARFDRVLVDAPCSGEGTLRRRRGRPPHQSASFRGYVTRVQEELLRKAIRLTRPGGTTLYVTCTFAPEENEAIVDRVLRDEPVDLDPLTLPVPHAPGLTAFEDLRFDPRLEGAARIYPHHLDSGGLFLARLRRMEREGESPSDGSGPEEALWRRPPSVFPGDDLDPAEAEDLASRARQSLESDFGIGADDLKPLRPIVRGGRLWLHALEEWPLEGWPRGSWRPISVGFRSVEFDSRGRPRPTNDLLQWAGAAVRRGVLDVDEDALLGLLGRDALPLPDADVRGPVALRFRGEVVGRGWATREGLRSEVPKARASDLENVVRTEGAGGPVPGPSGGAPSSREEGS